MNKLKGLKEKRNELVSKQKTMLSTAIDETRSLTEEEDTELRSVIEQIQELETEIETMEEEIRTSTIVINDEIVDRYRALAAEVINKFDSRCTFHDFRVVTGESHTNLIFDLVTPFDKNKSTPRIIKELAAEFKKKDEKINIVVTVEHSYV